MFGNNTYWWTGWLIFMLFAALNTVIFLLRDKPRLSYIIAYITAAYLMIYKTGELIHSQPWENSYKFPVEFSALSYFLFGIFVVFRIHKFDSFPVFVALLSGIIYSVYFCIVPDCYIRDRESSFSLAMSIVNHHALYFGSMLLIANVRRYHIRHIWHHFLGIGLLTAYAWIIYNFTGYSFYMRKPIIIQILDSSILSWLFQVENLKTWHKIVYYVFVFCTVGSVLAMFYWLNHKMSGRRMRKGLPASYLPSRGTDLNDISF